MNKLVLLLIISIFVVSTTLKATDTVVDKGKGHIGLTFSSFGNNDVIRKQDLMGSAGYYGEGFFTFGITYLQELNKIFDFETGIEYSSQKIKIVPMSYPSMVNSPSRSQFSLINIPASIRVNFLKYFFVNGGVFLDLDAGNSSPIDCQDGVGANVGIGIKYNFKGSISIFINPYSKMHSLVPFSSVENHQHILESGYRFGVLIGLN